MQQRCTREVTHAFRCHLLRVAVSFSSAIQVAEVKESPDSTFFVLLIVDFLTGDGNLVDNYQA